MKVEEATKVKEKLDDILLAVDEYGKQSQQFSKARQNLFDLLGVMNSTNDSLGKLLSDCDQYLNKASEVIDGEYFVKIQGVIDDINKTASDFEKCNDEASKSSVKLIEDSKRQLIDLADTLSKNIQTSIDKVNGTANDLQKYSSQASEKAQELIKSSNNHILQMIDNLNNACDKLVESNKHVGESFDIVNGNIKEASNLLNETIKDEIKKTNSQIDKIIAKLADIEKEEKESIKQSGVLKDELTNSISALKDDLDDKYLKIDEHLTENGTKLSGELQDVKDIICDAINEKAKWNSFIKKVIIVGGIALGIILVAVVGKWFI